MPTPFLTMTKESIKTKSPVADFLTLWRERIEHPLQFHHHRKLLIFLPLPECQLNPTSSASSTTSCLSCLPWPECQIKMSVGVMINHTRPKNKMSYMNRKHFCLQETQKTQCYTLLEQQTHEGNTELRNQRIQGTTWNWNRTSWKREKEKWIQRSKLHDYTQNRQVCTIGLWFYTEHFIYKSKETRVRNCRQRSH